MNGDTTVIYNGDCPICAREIGVYRARACGPDAPRFLDLNDADLAAFGLTPEAAARRLHVVADGRLLSGVDAFLVLWRATPGFGWLARLVALPGLRGIAAAVYDRVLAPALYAAHVRRQRRRH